ncbi:MAG: hypothetical protein DSY42_06040 [Aquifex sp.]|nr:MAG: hypothetical protein DSY42_06040 [Aquifex sp.]
MKSKYSQIILVSWLILTFIYSYSWSLTLEEAINEAIKRNLTLQAKKHSIQASRESYLKQLLSRFGQINLFWNRTVFKYERVVAPLSSPINLYQLPVDDKLTRYGIEYKLRVFDGFKQFNLIKLKKREYEKELFEFLRLKAQIKKKVKETYFELLIYRQKRLALESRLDALEQLYKIVEEAYKIGKKPFVDLVKIKSEVEKVRANILNVRALEKEKAHELSAILNKDITPD